MPYTGIEPGSELEKKIERCVVEVMEKHAGEEDFDKSNAIAICRTSIEGNEMNATHKLTLTPVTQQDIERWGNPVFADMKSGDLVKAEGVVLCNAERNANGDGISVENIGELAASLDMMPLDVDHRQDKVIGSFVNPRQEDWERAEDVLAGGALVADLVLYAKRFPVYVQEIRDGKRLPSIEARSTHVSCSVCGRDNWFLTTEEYCDHLQPMLIAGRLEEPVTRWHKNMSATGGGAVIHPAGSDTTFGNSFTVIAHQSEPKLLKKDVQAMIEAALTELKAEETNMTEPTIEELQAKVAESQARITELEDEVKQHATRAAEAVAQSRKDRLENAGMPADRIKQLEGQLPAMSDEVFTTLLDLQAEIKAAAVVEAEPVVEPDPVTPDPIVVGDEKPPEPKPLFGALVMETEE